MKWNGNRIVVVGKERDRKWTVGLGVDQSRRRVPVLHVAERLGRNLEDDTARGRTCTPELEPVRSRFFTGNPDFGDVFKNVGKLRLRIGFQIAERRPQLEGGGGQRRTCGRWYRQAAAIQHSYAFARITDAPPAAVDRDRPHVENLLGPRCRQLPVVAWDTQLRSKRREIDGKLTGRPCHLA